MKLVIAYALSFVGTPYQWGGEDPNSGYDCSGFVQEILKSVGLDPPGDQTAQGLYDHFQKVSVADHRDAGSLAFYGKSLSMITHVAFHIDPLRVIEAGGGGSQIKTREDAIRHHAFIRIRPYSIRPDYLTTLKIRYPMGGIGYLE